jgi:RND family efflux transporter MFP subunit
LAALSIALLVGCRVEKHPAAEQARWIQVATPTVQEQMESCSLSGTVVSKVGAQMLAFTVAGRVMKAGPREGESVRDGQILGSLDATSYAAGADAASAQVRAAQAAATRAEDELRRMKIIFDRQSLSENDYLKFNLADQAAREHLLQAQAGEKVAQKSLADTSLRTLKGGVVTRRLAEPGMMVAAGQPVFEISQLDPVEIQIGIPENTVGMVKLGQAAKITVPALPGESFNGKIGIINAAADPASRTYMARIEVRNPKGVLRLGMVAEAKIQGEKIRPMMLIPLEAVVRDEHGASTVFQFLPEANAVVSRRVELGSLEGTSVQVISGISADTPIVVAGQNDLRDGCPVVVVKALAAVTGKK